MSYIVQVSLAYHSLKQSSYHNNVLKFTKGSNNLKNGTFIVYQILLYNDCNYVNDHEIKLIYKLDVLKTGRDHHIDIFIQCFACDDLRVTP